MLMRSQAAAQAIKGIIKRGGRHCFTACRSFCGPSGSRELARAPRDHNRTIFGRRRDRYCGATT